ncbi:hypothetical protein B566_EDAN011943 [Ephemera danica]|nr:hypothetical protein B566_EDAN011943 [Ephemera danica]
MSVPWRVVLAEAVWDHVTMDSEELAFTAGTLIEVVDCTSDKDWWFGHVGDKKGWFPAAFVRFRVSQDDTLEDCLASMAASKAPSPGTERTLPDGAGAATSPRPEPAKAHARTRSSVSLLSNDQVRASVVREILSTERDFVRNLTDVVEGYLWECRRREDLFTSHQLANIFGNIEELLAFQSSFLSALETRVNLDDPCASCLGHTFLQHTSGFHVYSEYCNGHHIAQATLQELCAQPGYRQFFEACRLVRGLINISLDGFLLTPVQRICKYPLQLNELLKYTRADHPDYEDVRAALEAMRAVATLVNERKRRMESLEKLAAWQQRVEGWEGEDLIDLSSQLIHQGEAVRVTSGRWSSNVKLFLFDRQLLYCKRDLLRRGLFVYKGRIALDHCQVMDVPDGKDIHLGISVRHGIKLVSRSGPSGRPPVSRGAVQWLLLCFRSAEEKRCWLHALNEERLLVQAEEARGLELEPSAREVARLLCTSQPKGYSKRRAREAAHLVPHLATSETSLGTSCQSISGGDSSQQNSLGRKVGHWFTFSSKSKQHRRSPPNRGGSLQQLLPP